MGEEKALGQKLEEAATRYREAKARQDHLSERYKFADAALKALEKQCSEAHHDAERALSEVFRLAHGKELPKTEPNPGVGHGYAYVPPEVLKG